MRSSADWLDRTLVGTFLVTAAALAAHADQSSTKSLARGKKSCLNKELVQGVMTVSGSARDNAGNPVDVEWSIRVSLEPSERGREVFRTDPTATIRHTVHVNGAYARACAANPSASTSTISLSQSTE